LGAISRPPLPPRPTEVHAGAGAGLGIVHLDGPGAVRDRDAVAGPLRLDRQADGTYLLRTAAAALTFTEAEVRAFVAGIRDHEFDLAAYAPAA
jgi:hypothetical protein